MISQARLAASTSARRTLKNDVAAVSATSSTWGWSGRLVARILPKTFSEYESSKPKWAIDPSSLEGGVVEPITKVPVIERKGSEGSAATFSVSLQLIKMDASMIYLDRVERATCW